MDEHEHFEELVSLKLDGMLDDAGERELAEHLTSCAPCRELYELLTGVRKTLSVEHDPPEALINGVREGVERINKTRRSLRIRRGGIAAGLLAAAAVLVLAVLPRGDAGNGENPDDGIASYSLDDGPSEARIAIPDEAGGNRTVSLFPGELSIPVSGIDMSLSDYCADHYAVAYFEKLPEEIIESGVRCVFSDGTEGYEIPRELLDRFEAEAVMIEYHATDGETAMAVQTPEN